MWLWNYFRKVVFVEDSPSLITDLLWWRGRPNIVILQFAKRKIADQVYRQMMKRGQGATSKNAGVKIGNYLVQCKKLVDLLGLEWRSVNNETVQDSRMLPQSSTSLGSPPVKKRKIIASDTSSSSSSSVPAPTTSSPCLVTEINRLFKSVEVSSSVILQSKQIIEKLRRLMATKYPSCQFIIFRNIYLKISHPFSNDLVIFAHGGFTPAAPQSYLEVNIQEIASRKQANVEFRQVIRTEAWKNNWVEVRKLVGKVAGKEAEMEAREKMKFVRIEEEKKIEMRHKLEGL